MLSPNRISSSAGAQVVLASSNDYRHPPECIIDGNPDTYWSTTGLFPQEVFITLPITTSLTSVTLKTSNVRKICIEKSDSAEITDFNKIAEKVLDAQDGQIQCEEFKLEGQTSVRHLKIILAQGFEHFVSVHSVNISGP